VAHHGPSRELSPAAATHAYDCDCNGFVGFVLERFAPDHYLMIPKEPDQPRPRAFKYYSFFNSLNPQSPESPESSGGWHRIDFLPDTRRGDIIAWQFPEIVVDQNTPSEGFTTLSIAIGRLEPWPAITQS
jgi:hypothetical protein